MKKNITFKGVKLLFLLLNVFLGFTVHSETYYVSTSGKDTHTSDQAQNSSTPWKTINKLNEMSFKSGDVVLFKRGEIFRGEIKAISGVTYGAFGIGNLPIITGAVLISGWSLHKDNIYVATVNTPVQRLFVGKSIQTVARYPNSGFLHVDKGLGKTTFTDSEITQPSGYWDGANIRLRLRHYYNTLGTVTSHEGSTINFEGTNRGDVWNGFAYYFDNKLSELDTEGEWFYDATTSKLYFYAKGGVNPSTLKVEGVVFNYGFIGAKNTTGVTIKDLHIEKQAIDGVYLYNGAGHKNTVTNSKFYFQGENGISFMGNNTRIENNTFEDIDGRGIVANVSHHSLILNNTFKRLGMIEGYGINSRTGYTSPSAIILGANTSYFRIAHNSIDSIGYNGIRPDGTYHVVERNVIKNTLLNHSDGGAIYAWGDITHHNTIRDNFIFNPQGYSHGKLGGLAYGIYMDVNVHHCDIINNTIVGSEYGGILLNTGNTHNVVRKNTCFANKLSSIKLDDWTLEAPVAENRIAQNIVFTTNPSGYALHLNSKFNRFEFGTYDSNYYYNPYSDFEVRRSNYAGLPVYSVNQWKALSTQDPSAKKSIFNWSVCETTEVIGGNLINNGTFGTDSKGWSFSKSTNSQLEYLPSGISGGSIKYTMLNNTPNNGIVSSPSFAGEQNQTYELKFSVKSTRSGRINVILRQARSPYATLSNKMFPLEVNTSNYKHVFVVPITDENLRIDFEILFEHSDFTLDNVSLTKVNTACHNPRERSFIFTNPSNSIISVDLKGKTYTDLDGRTITGSLPLSPWSSKILVLKSGFPISPTIVNYLRTAENPINTTNGVKYSYYEGNWLMLPNFDLLTPKKSGIIPNINISERAKDDYFAFKYDTYISVPEAGEYTFYLSSDDGSKMFVGNTLIIDNDGRHAAREVSQKIGLKAGKHKIQVLYFENANGNSISLSYSGPGIAKQVVPASAYFYETSSTARIGIQEDEEMYSDGVVIFPNPTRGVFNINCGSNEISSVKIRNSHGIIVLERSLLKQSEIEIDGERLSRGIYLLEVKYASGKLELKRLVKE